MAAFEHVPVLFDACMQGLDIKPDGVYADGTAGGGSHSHGIGERLGKDGTLYAADRDIVAVETCRGRLSDLSCHVEILHRNFASLPQYFTEHHIQLDGLLLDLGVSSYQLDTPERGFSYRFDAPLDMRMNESASLTAREVVNTYPAQKLCTIFTEYGEERYSKKIAEAICARRAQKPLETTLELVDVIRSAMPAKALSEKQHPAKRVFQAIRIEVNDELGEISRLLDAVMPCMKSGGRVAVITFHSLEDRIVKKAFARYENPCTCPPDFPVCVCGKVPEGHALKVVEPSEAEINENPRARSARLRVFCKK